MKHREWTRSLKSHLGWQGTHNDSLLTWIPDVVKYGISNFTLMGGFPSLSSASTLGSPKWALIKYSFPPCKLAESRVSFYPTSQGFSHQRDEGKPSVPQNLCNSIQSDKTEFHGINGGELNLAGQGKVLLK